MKILVKRTAAVGDVIMSTVVIRELHAKNSVRGACVITVQTDCPDVFLAMIEEGIVSAVVNTADPMEFDLFINLDDSYESSNEGHYIQHMLNRAQLSVNSTEDVMRPNIGYTAADADYVYNFIKEHELTKFVVFHMRNWHWQAKNMPRTFWLDVMRLIYAERADFKVVTVGSPHDMTVDIPSLVVDARGKLSLQQLQRVLSMAEVFVGTDSAPYHLAQYTNNVLLATHLNPSRIAYSDTDIVVADIPCVGCYDRQPKPVRSIVCDTGDYRCTGAVSPDKVALKILKYLGN